MDLTGYEVIDAEKAVQYGLSMALLAFSDDTLRESLLKDAKLLDLLANVSEENIENVARVVTGMNRFKANFKSLSSEPNKLIQQKNQRLKQENDLIEAQRLAITTRLDELFAPMLQ